MLINCVRLGLGVQYSGEVHDSIFKDISQSTETHSK